MKLPNAVSVVALLAIVAGLEYIVANAAQLGSASWVPLVVGVAAIVAKGIQVYVQENGQENVLRAPAERKQHGKLRRTLLD